MNQHDDKKQLDISVIIATCDRARGLETTLDHLRRQEVEGLSWELIVIDNGSTDDTQAVLDRARGDFALVNIYEPISGKSRCINRALDVARGRLLVFTDDDVELTPAWIATMHRASKRYVKYAIFCGPVVAKFPPEMPAWLREHWFSVVAFGNWIPEEPEGPLTKMPCGANYAVRASAVAGLRFDTTLGPQKGKSPMGEESKFISRLLHQGERIIYVPSVPVKHSVPSKHTELSWLFTRAFRYGRGIGHAFPRAPIRLLYGVPIRLTRYLLSRLSSTQIRFETGIRFYMDWGELYEYCFSRSEESRPAGSQP